MKVEDILASIVILNLDLVLYDNKRDTEANYESI